MEADRLFRRGCLQYLEDLGLVNKADTVINPPIQVSQQKSVFVCVL